MGGLLLRGAAEMAHTPLPTCPEPSLTEADCGTQSWNGKDSGGQAGQAEGEESPVEVLPATGRHCSWGEAREGERRGAGLC